MQVKAHMPSSRLVMPTSPTAKSRIRSKSSSGISAAVANIVCYGPNLTERYGKQSLESKGGRSTAELKLLTMSPNCAIIGRPLLDILVPLVAAVVCTKVPVVYMVILVLLVRGSLYDI